MRENPTRRWRACATGSATLAMVLMVTACGTTPPVYTDASPPKLQRACQAVDEATGLQMTEIDRAWCRGMMQAWYSETRYTRPDPADQFTGTSQLRYLQAKTIDCRGTADAYELTGADRWEPGALRELPAEVPSTTSTAHSLMMARHRRFTGENPSFVCTVRGQT